MLCIQSVCITLHINWLCAGFEALHRALWAIQSCGYSHQFDARHYNEHFDKLFWLKLHLKCNISVITTLKENISHGVIKNHVWLEQGNQTGHFNINSKGSLLVVKNEIKLSIPLLLFYSTTGYFQFSHVLLVTQQEGRWLLSRKRPNARFPFGASCKNIQTDYK